MFLTLLKYDILHRNNPVLSLSKKRLFLMKREAYYARKRREIEKKLVKYSVYKKEF